MMESPRLSMARVTMARQHDETITADAAGVKLAWLAYIEVP
jgi:hypothetical protein